MIQADNICVSLSGRELVSQLSLSLGLGKLLCIVGANGAGKSTLLRALSGELPLSAGSIFLGEHCVSSTMGNTHHGGWFSVFDNIELARSLAVLPQSNHLNFPFNVAEVIHFGRTPHGSGKKIDAEIVNHLADMLDIAHLLHRSFTELSGGEKQRTQIARVFAQICRLDDFALANSEFIQEADNLPRVLLLDEPLSSLDLGHQQDVMRVIKKLNAQGVSVVMIVHDLNIAAQHADTILAMADGRVLASGSPQAVITTALLEGMFDVNASVMAHPDTGKPVVMPLTS